MTKLIAASAIALAMMAGVSATPSFAANARNPYSNVDKSNDKGNDTGDSQVDRLNAAQLNQNYQGGNPGSMQQPTMGRQPMNGQMPMNGQTKQ